MEERSALLEELRRSIAQIESTRSGAFENNDFHRTGRSVTEGRANPTPSASIPDRLHKAIGNECAPAGVSGNGSDGEGKSEPERALSKIIAVLNAGDKSERALRERLAKEGFDESAADEAIRKAKSYGFVDDARYADLLIRSRVAQGRGSVRIERELRENGIDPADVEGWPLAYGAGPDEEAERALDLLRRKPPHSKNPRESAFRKLVNKGYPTSVASSATRTWWEEAPLDRLF